MHVGTYHNLDGLADFNGGDKEFEAVMIQTFCEEALSLVDTIEKAHAEGDLESMGRAAHGLKPNAQIFGIASIHEDLLFVELAGKENQNKPELSEKIEEIRRVITQVVRELS